MIGVEVIGGCKRDRALAEDVVWFCLEKLLPKHNSLDITVTLKKTFEDGAWGFCYAGEDDRDLYIDIDHRLYKELGWEGFVDTICHEMIHVKQTVRGELKELFRGGYKRLWKCRDGQYRKYDNMPYERLPWECQAWKCSGPLMKEYKKEVNGS